MSDVEISAPDPVDVRIGKLLRAYRQFSDLTLDDLGKAIGVSAQQIQKYERGANRISASKLFEVARVLEMSPAAFFEGVEENERQSLFDHFTEFFVAPYSTRLASAFIRMNSHQQRALSELAETIAPSDT
ncbi:helix-turn-helix transcriptional regulator [Caulobacter sp.]|uniref:helix-turn-helix domain-containing protein n=1 Tax=Caulobacter sp. TaxID=78 RepID=UPI001B125E12|nr:helix-turn-helix transcriptional regulator [Caulobacter sp.]MBO9547009.1 helix-turn-helix transcriptional regulator [Caulobacter sp.]